MIECGLLSLAQLRTATAVKLKTNSLMSKSRQTITESGASASCSESVKKVLDTERRFIDDLMTLQNELLLSGSWWDSRTRFVLACRLDLKPPPPSQPANFLSLSHIRDRSNFSQLL